MVESVKELRAELEERILARPVEREPLREGEIEIVLCGAVVNSHAGVAESQGVGVGGAEWNRLRKAVRVDISADIRSDRPRSQIMTLRASTGEGGAISQLSKNVLAIRVEEDLELMPRLKRGHPGQPPTAQYLPSRG